MNRTQQASSAIMKWLAKAACHLPLPNADPVQLYDIFIASDPTPCPARKWIIKQRSIPGFQGTYWTSWLCLNGIQRMVSVTWLWGNARWEGCGAPWHKHWVECPFWGEWHQTMVHHAV